MTDISAHHAKLDQISKGYWRQYESNSDHADRVENAEIEAGRYFDGATVAQRAAYSDLIGGLSGTYCPRENRIRDRAKAAWYASTAKARELFELTFEELMATGEVSEALSERWDALAKMKQAEAA